MVSIQLWKFIQCRLISKLTYPNSSILLIFKNAKYISAKGNKIDDFCVLYAK